MAFARCSSHLALLVLCAACSGVGPVSAGPKIFVSSRGHLSDFIDDRTLRGTTPIGKADDFCNSDPSKPDDRTYKALLVDGVARSAKPALDWPLRANTTYYLPHDDLVIGTTDDHAIFDAEFMPLANAIGAQSATSDARRATLPLGRDLAHPDTRGIGT
jgi:hypothetical protein